MVDESKANASMEARREARRRRILENAETRLKRITTVQDIPDEPEVNLKKAGTGSVPLDAFLRRRPQTPAQTIKPQLQQEESKSPDADAKQHKTAPVLEPVSFSDLEHDQQADKDEDHAHQGDARPVRSMKVSHKKSNEEHNDIMSRITECDLDGSATVRTEEANVQKQRTNYRILIILLMGLAVRYLNLVFENCEEMLGVDLNYLHIDRIFMPFLVFEITEYFLHKPEVESSTALQLVIALNNMQGRQRLNLWVDAINRVLLLLKDMSIYFFAFIFLDMIFAVFDVEDVV